MVRFYPKISKSLSLVLKGLFVIDIILDYLLFRTRTKVVLIGSIYESIQTVVIDETLCFSYISQKGQKYEVQFFLNDVRYKNFFIYLICKAICRDNLLEMEILINCDKKKIYSEKFKFQNQILATVSLIKLIKLGAGISERKSLESLSEC